MVFSLNAPIKLYIHTHTHTHIYVYIYIYINKQQDISNDNGAEAYNIILNYFKDLFIFLGNHVHISKYTLS